MYLQLMTHNTTFAELSSALAGGLVSGDADGVNAGYNAGRNAVQWNYLNPNQLAQDIFWEEAQSDAEAVAEVMKDITDVVIPAIMEVPIPYAGSPRENIELITGQDFYSGGNKNKMDIIKDKGMSYVVNKSPISIPYNTYDYINNINNGYQTIHNQKMKIDGNKVQFYPDR
jgi:hypothetical protein